MLSLRLFHLSLLSFRLLFRALSNDILPEHHKDRLNNTYIGKRQHHERQKNQPQYPNSGTEAVAAEQRGLAVEAFAVFYDDLEQAAANRAPILESPLSSSLCPSLIDGLTPSQYRYCRRHPDATAAALDGLRAAVVECQWQMRGRRWNCSGIDGFRYGDRSNSATESHVGRRIRSPFDHPIAQKGRTRLHGLGRSWLRDWLIDQHWLFDK